MNQKSTMKYEFTTFEELAAARKRMADAHRENNATEGISHLLTELYPDNAHFIYELLQNAEDTQATAVLFTLTPNYLRFEHNGKRLFTIKDIESITSIGKSTKRDDATSIGKFGVGFKAVFAYTNTPQIHSGEFNIEIQDLVCPSLIDEITSSYDTCFVFPFNNEKKPATTAFNEVKRALLDLNENALLFLNSIKKISYEIEEKGKDSQKGSIVLEEIDSFITRIIQKKSQENDSSTLWLKFEKKETIKNEQGASVSCALAIAYSVKEKNNINTNIQNLTVDNKYEIIPVNQNHVFIYFPAIKETSNLKFHIHAPFASTVARDSVRDCKENELLRDGIAKLICESLEKIKALGLLTPSFLSVLPNKEDALDPFYKPIREAVLAEFKLKPLLPMKNGQYSIANDVYTGSREFSDLISDADLVFLTKSASVNDSEAAVWVDNLNAQYKRVNQFITDLSVESWGTNKMVAAIDSFDSAIVPHNAAFYQKYPHSRPSQPSLPVEEIQKLNDTFNMWIANKNDRFLERFYAILGSANINLNITNLNFIKSISINDKTNICFLKPKEVFLSIDHEIGKEAYVVCLGKTIIANAQTDADKIIEKNNKDIQNFYAKINIKSFDWKQSLIEKIAKMQNAETRFKSIDGPEYFEFIIDCVNYYVANKSCELFKNKKIFLASKNNNIEWFSAECIIISSPYIENDFEKIGFYKDDYFLSNKYFDFFDETNKSDILEKFVEMLKSLNATYELKLEPKDIKNRADYRRCYDFKNLKEIISSKNFHASKAVWEFLQNSTVDYHILRKKHYSTDTWKEESSEIVNILKEREWLPDLQGVFHKPCDIDEPALDPSFQINHESSQFKHFLNAINFAGKTIQKIAEEKDLNKIAEAAGYKSIDQMRRDKEFGENFTDDQKADILAKKRQEAEFPSPVSPNPALRSQRATEDARNAPQKEYENRERSVLVSRTVGDIAASKQYLKAFYTDETKALRCQCCEKSMPFRVNKGRGDYYFEVVQITKSTKEHPHYRLALCPTCAAMYRYANDQTDEEIQAKLRACEPEEGPGNAAIDIQLAGRPMQLRFVTTHLNDVQDILKEGV